jgi:uncharacterized protein HemX
LIVLGIADKALAYAAVAVALVAGTAAGVFAWQAHQADKALDLCNANKATLEAKIDEQNRSIETWATAASAATANTAKALLAAQEVSKSKAGQIAALQAQIKASPNLSCTDAVRQVRERLAK